MNGLNLLSDEELMRSTDRAVAKEKEAITITTRHFQEVYRRRTYLPAYANMIDFLTRKYGYCAGSAQLRIATLQLIRQVPAVQEKIESGAMSMTVAANIQTFLNSEAKAKRPYSVSAKVELVDACLGKSKLEAQKEFARRNPEFEKRESIRYVSEKRVRIDVSISEEALEKLNRLRDLFSHVDPSMSLGSLIERLAEEGIEKHCPRRKAERVKQRAAKKDSGDDPGKVTLTNVVSEKLSADQVSVTEQSAVTRQNIRENEMMSGFAEHSAATKESAKNNEMMSGASAKLVHPDEPTKKHNRTRYTVAKERHRVVDDGNGCSFVDKQSGHRCGSKKFLQLDHVIPFAEGGPNTAANLRWMCGAHNRWRADVGTTRH